MVNTHKLEIRIMKPHVSIPHRSSRKLGAASWGGDPRETLPPTAGTGPGASASSAPAASPGGTPRTLLSSPLSRGPHSQRLGLPMFCSYRKLVLLNVSTTLQRWQEKQKK